MSTPRSRKAAEHAQGPVSDTVELRMSIADMRAAVGASVRNLREHAEQTLIVAAEGMHLSPLRLQQIEDGEVDVSLDDLVRVADGLGVSVETLFANV